MRLILHSNVLSPAAVFTFTLGPLSLVAGGAGAKSKALQSDAGSASDAAPGVSDEVVEVEVETAEMPCGDFEGGEEEVPAADDACVEESSETALKPKGEDVD